MSIAEKLTTIAENEPKVYEAGRRSFWEDFQEGGNRKHYNYTFAYGAFNRHTFEPIYTLDCTDGGASLFRQYTDSASQKLTYPYETAIKEINVPIIFGTGTYVFDHCYYLKTIKKIIVTSSTSFSNWFRNCTELTDVTFEGEIANNLDMSSCPKLSVKSMESIIGCVVSPIQLKFHELAWARLEDYSTAPNGATWKSYVQTELGCSI